MSGQDRKIVVLNWETIYNLIVEILEDLQYPTKDVRKTLDLIKANFVEYTAASHKSLMQKLIRFRSKRVSLMPEIQGGGIVDTQLVLLMSMGALVINPGSFVPDIQRYVTGLESFAKRLAVIILEDSSTDDPRKLVLSTLWSSARSESPDLETLAEATQGLVFPRSRRLGSQSQV